MVAPQDVNGQLDRAAVIDALTAYRAQLKAKGKILKAAVVAQCLAIVRRL